MANETFIRFVIPLIVGILIFLTGSFIAIRKRHELQKMSMIMSLTLSFAISALVFPYFVDNSKTLLFAILASLRYGTVALGMNVNGGIVYEMELTGALFKTYSFTLSVFYVLGPIFASIFMLGFSRTIVEYIRFGRYRTVHVFSELNARSAVIAESLYEKNPREVRVFCASDSASDKLKASARASHSMIVRQDEKGLHLRSGNIYHFYEIYDDSDLTLRKTASLIQHLKKKKTNAEITVRSFINREQLELVRDMDMRLKDENISFRIRYLDENQAEAVEMFHKMVNRLPFGTSGLHYDLLLIGCGDCGLSILRTAAWLMVQPDSSCTIHVVDSNARKIASQLKGECPEYLNAPLEEYFHEDAANKNYDIVFHAMDAESSEFTELLERLDSIDLVTIALKEDVQNHRIAKKVLRTLAASSPDLSAPPVAVRIRSSKSAELLKGDNVYCFGSMKKHYNFDSLVHPELEKAARVTHLSYCGADKWTKQIEEDFYRYVNYDSSFAQALTMVYRRQYILSLKPDGVSGEEWIRTYLSDSENLTKLGNAEHLRWNAYQRTNGWRTASLEQADAIARATNGKRVKDDRLLLHAAIVPVEELAQREKDVDAIRRKYDPNAKGCRYVTLDQDIIRCLPDILKSEPISK